MTGHKIVDGISKINFSGNIIPSNWFKQIRFEDGKPDTVAIILLSDIVYWYRAAEQRDEVTGKTIGFKKRFKADKLQKHYSAMAEQYGFTKRQVQEAINRLKEKGIITIELRTVTANSGAKLGNVVFIEPVVDIVSSITHPHTSEGEPYHVETGEGITFESDTLHKITYTENTSEIYNDKGVVNNSTLPSQNLNNVDNSQTEVQQMIAYYLAKYQEVMEDDHPRLKKSQWERIKGVLSYFTYENNIELDHMQAMINHHFERSMSTDYNINHMMTEGVLQNIFYEVLY